jgi:hypothetical protein
MAPKSIAPHRTPGDTTVQDERAGRNACRPSADQRAVTGPRPKSNASASPTPVARQATGRPPPDSHSRTAVARAVKRPPSGRRTSRASKVTVSPTKRRRAVAASTRQAPCPPSRQSRRAAPCQPGRGPASNSISPETSPRKGQEFFWKSRSRSTGVEDRRTRQRPRPADHSPVADKTSSTSSRSTRKDRASPCTSARRRCDAPPGRQRNSSRRIVPSKTGAFHRPVHRPSAENAPWASGNRLPMGGKSVAAKPSTPPRNPRRPSASLKNPAPQRWRAPAR